MSEVMVLFEFVLLTTVAVGVVSLTVLEWAS
jgi:hypothetical protein